MFSQSLLLAVSMQFFTVLHHDPPHHMAHAEALQYNTGVEYLLDPHWEVGDTVLVLYDDDEIVYEKKFDLFTRYDLKQGGN